MSELHEQWSDASESEDDLNALLAFVDEFDHPGRYHTGQQLARPASEERTASTSARTKHRSRHDGSTTARKDKLTTYTRMQEERADLQRLAMQLECRLTAARERIVGYDQRITPRALSSMWETMAQRQYQDRHRAEMEN